MSTAGQPEGASQNRVVVQICDELHYRHLSDSTGRNDNNNVEAALLSNWNHLV